MNALQLQYASVTCQPSHRRQEPLFQRRWAAGRVLGISSFCILNSVYEMIPSLFLILRLGLELLQVTWVFSAGVRLWAQGVKSLGVMGQSLLFARDVKEI